MKAVVLEKVRREFGSLCALEGLDLTLEAGEVLGLLGHNGAGKSTAMKLILGVLAPTSGHVSVLGQDPRGHGAGRLRLQLGYLPENVSFYDNLTGREVLRYFARLKRVTAQEANQLLEQVGLAEAAGRRVRTYSKGMRQRLGLAQALLGRPKLLLLDEPTVGLDPMATRDVYTTIDRLRGEGTAVILCSHVLPGVEKHVDRVAILGRGRLLAEGTMDALRQQAALPLTIHAHPAMNDTGLKERLNGRILSLEQGEDDDLVIQIPAEEKLPVLQALMQNPGLRDVSVEVPTLETLYAHFDRQLKEGVARNV